MVKLSYPSQLPVTDKVDEIKSALKEHSVVIVAGETGSGKTTQLPKVCLELGMKKIAHTQPRRIAARSVASRIAEELAQVNPEWREWVGYKVRFSDTVSASTRIKLMTDGMLLAEIRNSPELDEYDAIIVDEAHERTLNIDFLLGFLFRLIKRRRDLKIIITSATIDIERFSKHFNAAPAIHVSGRNYPVTMIYRPNDEGSDLSIGERITGIIEEIASQERKMAPTERPARDILAFFSGERDIREVSGHLRKRLGGDLEVLPLYARLGTREQNLVFKLGKRRRIVLATNVAETSLTVPNIGYVIDTGAARISRYSARTKMQRLPIEPISQASAKQRAGRCGRIGPGVCYRLYSEEDLLNRAEFTEPEIQRTNLASVILQLHDLGLGPFAPFPFIDRPDQRLVNDGYQLLEELGALHNRKRVTRLGRQLSQLPIDPRLARAVLEASRRGCLQEVLIIVSGLSLPDPRDTPLSRNEEVVQLHQQWVDDRSEFIGYLNLWNSLEEAYESCTRSAFSRWCKKHVLSEIRVREWRALHRQLKLVAKSLRLSFNVYDVEELAYAPLHLSLLTGFLQNIAQCEIISDQSKKSSGRSQEMKQRERSRQMASYLGIRNRKLSIFPGSTLKKKQFKWLMAAEIIETQKVYAHRVARIEPEWIEKLAGRWIKKSYSEPHWEKKRAQVVALEQATYYGLVIYSGRRVNFAPIDPVGAREIFIRDGLVAQQLNEQGRRLPDFYGHNRQLREQVEELENKRRRRNILVDDQIIYEFYDSRLPEEICHQKSLTDWVKREQNESLFMQQSDLMSDDADDITDQLYPSTYTLKGQRFDLSYQFEPGSPLDGVTITVPLPLLPILDPVKLEWLVPGLLSAKCDALLRTLPKAKRKKFVPVPNYVDAFLKAYPMPDGSLYDSLSQFLWKLSGERIEEEDWGRDQLDPAHFFHLNVVDNCGKTVKSGRNMQTLKKSLDGDLREMVASSTRADQSVDEPEVYTRWSFPDLPFQVEKRVAGQRVTLYPALHDSGNGVTETLLPTVEERDGVMRGGLLRLFVLKLNDRTKYLNKAHKGALEQLALQLFSGRGREELLTDLVEAVARDLFVDEGPLLLQKCEFDQRFDGLAPQFLERFQLKLKLAQDIAKEYRVVKKRLATCGKPQFLESIQDVKSQLDRLMLSNFLRDTPEKWFGRYPSYLKAVDYRLQRLPEQLNRDRKMMMEWGQVKAKTEKWLGKLPESDPRREEVFWWLEELRVSLFAQTIGAGIPISEKRIEKFLAM